VDEEEHLSFEMMNFLRRPHLETPKETCWYSTGESIHPPIPHCRKCEMTDEQRKGCSHYRKLVIYDMEDLK